MAVVEVLPYRIHVPQASVDRLKLKLSLADFPDELTDAGQGAKGEPFHHPPFAHDEPLCPAQHLIGVDLRKGAFGSKHS
jgi:hypothetical protein